MMCVVEVSRRHCRWHQRERERVKKEKKEYNLPCSTSLSVMLKCRLASWSSSSCAVSSVWCLCSLWLNALLFSDTSHQFAVASSFLCLHSALSLFSLNLRSLNEASILNAPQHWPFGVHWNTQHTKHSGHMFHNSSNSSSGGASTLTRLQKMSRQKWYTWIKKGRKRKRRQVQTSTSRNMKFKLNWGCSKTSHSISCSSSSMDNGNSFSLLWQWWHRQSDRFLLTLLQRGYRIKLLLPITQSKSAENTVIVVQSAKQQPLPLFSVLPTFSVQPICWRQNTFADTSSIVSFFSKHTSF